MGNKHALDRIRSEFPFEIVRHYLPGSHVEWLAWERRHTELTDWLATQLGPGSSCLTLAYPNLPIGDWAQDRCETGASSFFFRHRCDAVLFHLFEVYGRGTPNALFDAAGRQMPYGLLATGPHHLDTYRSVSGILGEIALVDPKQMRWTAYGMATAPTIRLNFRSLDDAMLVRLRFGSALEPL